MKILLSLPLLALLTFGANAQLSMPDAPQANDATAQPTQATPDANVDAGAQQAPEQKPSRYNTPSQSYKAERNDIRRGNKLFKEDKFHEALESYDKALEVNGGSIRARYNKAVTLLQLQSDDNKGTANDPRVQAAQLFMQLVPDAKEYDPAIAEKALYNLGNIAFNDEKYDESIAFYESSLRMQPDNLACRQNLRLAQLKKEQQEQNQDQQDQEDKQDQQQQQQEQQQQQQQQQDQQQQQQQQQQQMTGSAQQILQSMQNKENATRKKVQAEEEQAGGRPQTDKPW